MFKTIVCCDCDPECTDPYCDCGWLLTPSGAVGLKAHRPRPTADRFRVSAGWLAGRISYARCAPY
jgi:hypothetical protein